MFFRRTDDLVMMMMMMMMAVNIIPTPESVAQTDEAERPDPCLSNNIHR
jgi:hypothetical protein